MLTCPNLRRLSVDIAQPQDGCVVYCPLPEYTCFGFSQGERPPPLEELELISYPWGHEQGDSADPRFNLFAMHCLNYPEKGLETDYWTNTFDWSQLRALRDVSISLANKIAPKLTSLKVVGFKSDWDTGNKSIARFFDDLPSSLECIVLPKLSSAGIYVLSRHQETMRKLVLHRGGSWNGSWGDHVITRQELIALRDNLPHLEELEIDMARDHDKWPWDLLSVLAGFPKLTSLKLWYELGRGGKSPTPYLTAVSAAELFSFLRRSSPRKHSILQFLHACSGVPMPLGHGFFSDTAYWSSENSTSFVCRMAERDNEAANGELSVMCPDLSEKLNAKMEQIIKGQEKRLDPEDDDNMLASRAITLKVALDGPMAEDEWPRLRRNM
jgi:hypothetical protein